MNIKRGLSFQWDEGSGAQHTWFVVTHEQDNTYILLNISSKEGKRFIDRTCELDVRVCRYPKITKDSFVFYQGACLKTKNELLTILDSVNNKLNPQAPCWLIDKMASGLTVSMSTAMRVKNHYKKVYNPHY